MDHKIQEPILSDNVYVCAFPHNHCAIKPIHTHERTLSESRFLPSPLSIMRPSLLSLAALASSASAGVHELWWNVTYVEDVNPDGLFPRRVIGVNNTWP